MTSGRDASNTSDHDGSCAVMTNEAFVVETRDLTKRYSDRIVAVDHLNLRVRQGEVYGFLGPNDVGKTTTLRMLLGLVRPASVSAGPKSRGVAPVRIMGHDGCSFPADSLHPNLYTPRGASNASPPRASRNEEPSERGGALRSDALFRCASRCLENVRFRYSYTHH